MITEIKNGDIFAADVDCLVNPVNCVGVAGAGLAKQFKIKFPYNFEVHKTTCNNKVLDIGIMSTSSIHMNPSVSSTTSALFIINFPTKKHWLNPSNLEWIELGLIDLVSVIVIFRAKSIAIPALGCGLGGLNWSDVKPLIYKHLSPLEIDVLLFAPLEKKQ